MLWLVTFTVVSWHLPLSSPVNHFFMPLATSLRLPPPTTLTPSARMRHVCSHRATRLFTQKRHSTGPKTGPLYTTLAAPTRPELSFPVLIWKDLSVVKAATQFIAEPPLLKTLGLCISGLLFTESDALLKPKQCVFSASSSWSLATITSENSRGLAGHDFLQFGQCRAVHGKRYFIKYLLTCSLISHSVTCIGYTWSHGSMVF